MAERLFIHAPNVHLGGGRILLDALLTAIPSSFSGASVLLDSRMMFPKSVPGGIQVRWVRPSVIGRFKAERWLASNVRSGDIILCFGNLPPLFKLRGRVVAFIQNRYLIDDVRLDDFPMRVRARLSAERLWLSKRIDNVDEFFVQTPTMKKLLEARVHNRVPIHIFPFVSEPQGYMRNIEQIKTRKRENCDFLYVASGEPHKNHRRMIDAWCLLAKEGLFPSLRLTLDEACCGALCHQIEEARERYGLKVTNMGVLSHSEVLTLYKKVSASIYPSTFESLGLPLIEARRAGLPVLASESDYVRDVLDPEETFNPESAISIARAVKRFMGVEEQPLPLSDAAEFINHILGRSQ